MKTIKNMLYIAAMTTAITACSSEEILTPEANAPLTISATIPGDVWAVATRTGLDNSYTDGPGMTVTMTSYTNWTLHYTDYSGAAATGVLTATPTGNSTFSLTSGSDLVWAKVKDGEGDETFYLTCEGSDGVTYYATTTAAHGAAPVAFATAMKPTLAKLTVNFTLSHNMASNPSDGDFSILIDAKQQGDSYDPMNDGGVWPVGDEDAIDGPIFSKKSSTTNTYTVTATMLLPQQVMGNTLTVTYKETTWTLNLSTVSVTGSTTVQTANMLIAGQHLTLNLSTSILSVGAPGDIEIEAFTAADEDSYVNDLDGTANKSNQ